MAGELAGFFSSLSRFSCFCVFPKRWLRICHLTKEEAANVVKEHPMFKDVIRVSVKTGVIHASLADIDRYQPKYSVLKSMGLVELTGVKIESRDEDTTKSTEGTRVSLTEKGVAESKSWKQLSETSWEIPAAKRVMVEVLEIYETDGKITGIDFLWLWEVNPMGKALDFTFRPERARATFGRKNGEWKIASVRAIS